MSFSPTMFLPSLNANVLRHSPPPSSPPIPGTPPSPFMHGDESGLCGLTNNQWHLVLIFSIPREWAINPFPPILSILKRKRCACSAVLVTLLIALVISWLKGSEISFLWLRVQDRVKLTRMGAFPTFPFRTSHDTDELSLSLFLPPPRQSIPNNFRVA